MNRATAAEEPLTTAYGLDALPEAVHVEATSSARPSSDRTPCVSAAWPSAHVYLTHCVFDDSILVPAMNDFPSGELAVLRDVSRRLDEAAIPYMVTGSLALSFYATPRTTRAIDVVAELERRDVDRVVQVFEPDYYVSREAVSEAINDRSSFNLIEQSSITKVDVFPRKRGRFRQTEFARRRRVTIGDFDTWLVTAEDLIIAKMLWAQDTAPDTQLRDIRALLHADLDRPYIEQWARELALTHIWQEARR